MTHRTCHGESIGATCGCYYVATKSVSRHARLQLPEPMFDDDHTGWRIRSARSVVLDHQEPLAILRHVVPASGKRVGKARCAAGISSAARYSSSIFVRRSGVIRSSSLVAPRSPLPGPRLGESPPLGAVWRGRENLVVSNSGARLHRRADATWVPVQTRDFRARIP